MTEVGYAVRFQYPRRTACHRISCGVEIYQLSKITTKTGKRKDPECRERKYVSRWQLTALGWRKITLQITILCKFEKL